MHKVCDVTISCLVSVSNLRSFDPRNRPDVGRVHLVRHDRRDHLFQSESSDVNTYIGTAITVVLINILVLTSALVGKIDTNLSISHCLKHKSKI